MLRVGRQHSHSRIYLVLVDHVDYVLAQVHAAGFAGVEHVATGVFVDGDAGGVGTHERHLVDGQDRAHEGAREVVPAVGDDDAHLGISGDGLPQVFNGALAQLIAAIPEAVYFKRESVVAGIDFPANGAGHEIDHGSRGRRDEGFQHGIAEAPLGRVGEGVIGGHVRVVDGADFAFLAVDFAQVGSDFKTASGIFHELRVEAGHVGDALDDARGGFWVGASFEEVGRVIAERVGDDLLHGVGGELVLALKAGGGD